MCVFVCHTAGIVPPSSPPSVSHSGKKCWQSCQCSPSQTEKSGLRTHSVRNLERSLAAYQGGRGGQYSWRPKLKACPTNPRPPPAADAAAARPNQQQNDASSRSSSSTALLRVIVRPGCSELDPAPMFRCFSSSWTVIFSLTSCWVSVLS